MTTPEEESKRLVTLEHELIVANAAVFVWEARLEDRGDYAVVFVRFAKPGGRTFLVRLECDDYPRQAPLAQFVHVNGWSDEALKDVVDPESFPKGSERLAERPGKKYRVMCIRGHREYYEGGWHDGWTNPPDPLDRINQLAVNIRRGVYDLWQ